jgi:hypothetical protein
VSDYPQFPEISRAFSLKQSEVPVDPTIRDSMENGMETSRARFTRLRRTFQMTVDAITADDKDAITNFLTDMKGGAAYGALPFNITDPRNQENPCTYLVRFASLPKFVDLGWIGPDDKGNAAGFRFNCTFEVREI